MNLREEAVRLASTQAWMTSYPNATRAHRSRMYKPGDAVRQWRDGHPIGPVSYYVGGYTTVCSNFVILRPNGRLASVSVIHFTQEDE